MYSTDSFLVNDRQVDRKLNFLKYIDRNKTWLLESCDLRFQIGFLVPSDSNTSHNPRYISQHILFKIRKAPIFLYLSIFNEIFNHNFFLYRKYQTSDIRSVNTHMMLEILICPTTQ